MTFLGAELNTNSNTVGLPQEKIGLLVQKDKETDGSGLPTCQSMPEHFGINVIHFPNGPVGSMAHEDIPELVFDTMEWNINASTDPCQQIGATIGMVVDSGPQPQTSSAYCSSLTVNNQVTCRSARMGISLSGLCGPGTLEFPTTGHSLEHPGVGPHCRHVLFQRCFYCFIWIYM